jgi:hypothetical protein
VSGKSYHGVWKQESDTDPILGSLEPDLLHIASTKAVPNEEPAVPSSRDLVNRTSSRRSPGFDLHRFQPKTFLASGNLVVVRIDVELTVKATGTPIVEEDEVHIWYFDSQGRVTRFGHKLDTHQHWLACGGARDSRQPMAAAGEVAGATAERDHRYAQG